MAFLRTFIAYADGVLKSDVLSLRFAAHFPPVTRSCPPLLNVKGKEPSALPPAIGEKSDHSGKGENKG